MMIDMEAHLDDKSVRPARLLPTPIIANGRRHRKPPPALGDLTTLPGGFRTIAPNLCLFDPPDDTPWGRSEALCPRCGRTHWIRIDRVDDALVVALSPARSLDSTELSALNSQLLVVLHTALDLPNHWIILDFEDTRVWTLSERALKNFATIHHWLQSKGGRLILCRLRPDVRESLDALGYGGSFTIEPDVQAALDAL